MFKKLTVLFVLFALVFGTFAACQKDDIDTSSSATQSQTSSGTQSAVSDASNAEEDIYAHLKGINLGGRDIRILVEDNGLTRYWSRELLAHEDNPEIINTAIEARNEIVESLLNCNIVEERALLDGDMLNTIRQEMLGTGTYDLVMPYMTAASTLAAEGAFYDLNKFPVIKLDKSYWDQRAVSDLSVAGRNFFATGDFSLLTFDCTHAIVFNKSVVQNTAGIDDPYELLANNNWTFDTLYENAKKVTADSDGEAGMAWSDTWGFFFNANFLTSMFVGTGERLTGKDSNDYPYLTINSQRASSVVDSLISICMDEKASISIEQGITNFAPQYNDVWSAATGSFAENRALFRSLSIVDLNELQNYENVNYGLLPVPKYNSDQDGYYNIVSAVYASCFAIPTSCTTPEDSAAVAEAIACSSTETVRKNYYEVLLKSRQIADNDGWEALDLIFNNRVYEMGAIYSWGSLSSMIYTIVLSGQNTLTSTYDQQSGTINAAISDTIEAFKSIS